MCEERGWRVCRQALSGTYRVGGGAGGGEWGPPTVRRTGGMEEKGEVRGGGKEGGEGGEVWHGGKPGEGWRGGGR